MTIASRPDVRSTVIRSAVESIADAERERKSAAELKERRAQYEVRLISHLALIQKDTTILGRQRLKQEAWHAS